MQIQALSHLDTGNAISLAVAKKAMQADRAQGEALIEMLKSCCDRAPGERGASPAGVGAKLDVLA